MVSACPNTASAESSQKIAPDQEIPDRTSQLRTESNHRKGCNTIIKEHYAQSETNNYSLLYPAFVALAHLAF